ncbi:antitoxin VapB family protein [Candidatus Woesearchaeota archaeon]|nr:antitoxin VapB family protein [Candidatus Woesearchaeota archaeon]
MTIKSLTITEDAYDALRRLKQGEESFSHAILRLSSSGKGLPVIYFGCLSQEEGAALRREVDAHRKDIEEDAKRRIANVKKALS